VRENSSTTFLFFSSSVFRVHDVSMMDAARISRKQRISAKKPDLPAYPASLKLKTKRHGILKLDMFHTQKTRPYPHNHGVGPSHYKAPQYSFEERPEHASEL